jgi:2-haloacid dehalogenase
VLHHSLVESITGNWNNFGDIAQAILEKTAAWYDISLPTDAAPIAGIIAAMPAHLDVAAGLAVLQQQGFTLISCNLRTLQMWQLTQ